MWYSFLSYLVPLNMSTFTCGKQRFLTTEEVAAIFENRKSVDPLSDYSSSNESLLSSIWESSDVDSADSDDETDFSGSMPPEIASEIASQGEASNEDSEPDMNGCLEQTLNGTGNDNSDFEDHGVEPPCKKIRIDSERQRLGRGDSERGRGRGRGHRRGRGGECGRGRSGGCGWGRSGGCGRRRSRGGGCGRSGGRGRGRSGGRGRGRSGGRGRGRSGGRRRGRSGGRRRGNGGPSEQDQRREQSDYRGRGRKRQRTQGTSLPEDATSISVVDSQHIPEVDFCPLRPVGPHVPLSEVNALALFELFFDEGAMDRILRCTTAYAEHKKEEKKKRYALFMKRKLTKEELKAFIGALLLLGIHGVRNHRKAWSTSKAQHLTRLHDLMTCQRFELIGCFLHVVTPEEEEQMGEDRLRKLRPFVEIIKANCSNYYQPLQQLSVDERMVKSKCRSHMIQYMKDKPTKWGFKVWVIADISGYTCDFNIYTGKGSTPSSEQGLSFDVVMELVAPFEFQGYELFTDNFYSSPSLFDALLEVGIRATGTLRTNRTGVPESVVQVKQELMKTKTARGTGYYVHESSTTYVCWRDVRVVTVITTAYPGHYEHYVTRKVRKASGQMEAVDIPRPIAVEKYNRYMGGVDKSDQFLSYHNVLRKTVRYWKTLFYHMIDIAAVNAFVLYNLLAHQSKCRTITENDFRDTLVLQIIEKYGRNQREAVPRGRPPTSSCRVRHGSTLYSVEMKGRCQYCKLSGKKNYTQPRCPDCLFTPALCQTHDRDCHGEWHKPTFDGVRTLWFDKQERKGSAITPQDSNSSTSREQVTDSLLDSSTSSSVPLLSHGRGRPRGSINKRKRRGAYRARLEASSR